MQTIVWQFRVLLISFMLSLVLKFFKRKSNKSHICTVNVAILNDTTVRMTWKKNVNRRSLTATKTKQRMEWLFSKQFEILPYLFPRNYTASGISFFKRIRRLLQILFFAHFKKLCGLSLTESSNDSEFHQVPFLQKMKQSTTNGSKYGWTTVPLSSSSSRNYTGSRIIPSPKQNHQFTKNSTVIFKLPLFKKLTRIILTIDKRNTSNVWKYRS